MYQWNCCARLSHQLAPDGIARILAWGDNEIHPPLQTVTDDPDEARVLLHQAIRVYYDETCVDDWVLRVQQRKD